VLKPGQAAVSIRVKISVFISVPAFHLTHLLVLVTKKWNKLRFIGS
jgi:hypothetical protein